METYRVKIKKRRIWLIVELIAALLVVGAAGAYSYFVLSYVYAEDWLRGFVLGIGFGLLVAVVMFVVYDIVKCSQALKNEERLRKMYIAETDERTRLINDKVGSFGFSLGLGGLAVAGAAASLLHPVVSVTLFAALAFMTLVKAGLTFYYNKRL